MTATHPFRPTTSQSPQQLKERIPVRAIANFHFFFFASLKKASGDHNVRTSIVPNLIFSLWSNERIAFRWMCDCAETMSSAVSVCRLYFKYSTYGTMRFFCTHSLELRHKMIYTGDFFSVFLYFLTLKTQSKFDSALGCAVPEHLIRINPSNRPNDGTKLWTSHETQHSENVRAEILCFAHVSPGWGPDQGSHL